MAFIKSKIGVWTLPPDIRDLIPSDHICYLVESFVDEIDFSEFEIRYDGSGHPAYHPRIMPTFRTIFSRIIFFVLFSHEFQHFNGFLI